MKKYICFLQLLVMASFISGCSHFGALKVDEELVGNMISLNANGETFNIEYIKNLCEKGTTSSETCTKENLLNIHINQIFNNLQKIEKENSKIEILLFIHGGLVPKRKAAIEAKKIAKEINEDNKKRKLFEPYVYPIFVNWESSMSASYKNHLLRIRQGEKRSKLFGWSTSPFYLIADTGRALTRLPITYTYQTYNMIKPVKTYNNSDLSIFNKNFYTEGKNNGHGISLGENRINNFSKIINKSTYVFPGVFKIITTPILDMVGKSSWDNMLRRTKTLFRTPGDFKINASGNSMNQEPNGGLSKLMRMLRKLKVSKNADKFSVTLMGHSMGTIVASEILRKYSENEDFDYDNIVYMAAATSIRDFETSVVPYLKAHSESNFYNLTLHPYAEENENTGYDFLPRGSLLVWLDDFATIPATPADKTLGKWNNAIRAWPYIPNEIRSRITLKGFGVVNDSKSNITDPQKHGQFNDVKFRFWRHKFREIN
jgi:pimeloyl-ACP methyl ester carboxylesterase